MQGIITSNTYVRDVSEPIIFLAGPDTNAPNWHDQAIGYLFSHEQNLVIACPRRRIDSSYSPLLLSSNEDFSRAREWERHYLDLASQQGAILFWLPGEARHTCDKVYGAMTRLELGQWMTRHHFDLSVRFCVGSDGKFPELRTIAYDLSCDAPGKMIFGTLEETCDEALRLVRLGKF